MKLRQEQLVFLAALALVCLLGYGLFDDDAAPRQPRGGSKDPPALEHHRSPAVDLVEPLAPAPATVEASARALFAPPRDTHPLPVLELVEPPRAPLAALLPPTEPGLAPRVFGRFLRRRLEVHDVPELFAEVEEEEPSDEEAEAEDDGPSPPSLVPSIDAAGTEDPIEEETPAERTARINAAKQRYDWLQVDPIEPWFGRIENAERYGLATDPARASEAILFVRLDSQTGKDFFQKISSAPIAYERSRFSDFGFADTVANRIELGVSALSESFDRPDFRAALALADLCVRHRLDAPRALEIAGMLYQRCAAFDPKDPSPLLGLARCYEAGFEFERAFATYEDLLEGFGHRAEVHARLALLEERFLLFQQAEARLVHAVSIDRSSWEAEWALGAYLLRRGRSEEALEPLRQAARIAPQEPELLSVRVAIRTDLAAALFARGDVAEASRVFDQALAADPAAARALAGRIGAGLADPAFATSAASASSGVGAELAGFELLLALGIRALDQGRFEDARDLLQRAADADPLRRAKPLGALSYLAEATGHEEEALRFVEEALEADPTDAWALVQRGRLLGARDDYAGAKSSLLAALERELDFEDALVALGDMAFRLGRFEDAERFLERAVSLEGTRAEVHTLRGLNYLRLRSVPDARASFERALALDASDATAKGGLAWCTYLAGDSTEALVELRNLDEDRRARPENDPWRLWASAQIERITDHERKEEWVDSFNRKKLLNGWRVIETGGENGPNVTLEEGSLEVEGVFQQSGEILVVREHPANQFVSFQASLWVDPQSNVRVGVLAAREQERRGSRERIGEASISRHKDGSLQVRLLQQGNEAQVLDMEQPFPVGQWVRLAIERTGEASESRLTFSLDGVPLLENVSLPGMGRAAAPLMLGLFIEGDPGRTVLVRLDDAAHVYRRS